MSRFILLSSAAFVSLLAVQARADEPVEKVVVTASRIGAMSADRLGTAVTVLDRSQLEDRQTVFLSDALRDVPGVAVSRAGAVGGVTQVRMRGAEGNHTLVLLDGAEISDPFQGEFDFAGLRASDIERVEILRGSQSALYGSDAIGGVVNIIPRRGAGALSAEAIAEAGSFATWAAGANAGYGDDMFDVFGSASHFATAGTNISRFGSERDGARDTSLFLNAGVRPSDVFEVRGFLRYVDTFAEGDPQDFAFPSTPTQGLITDGNEASETDQLYGTVQAELSLLDDRWQTRASYAFADTERRNYSFGFPSFFTAGHRDKVSLVSGFTLDAHKLTGAIDWKRETYQNLPIGAPTPLNDERVLETTGYVLSYDLSLGDFDAGAAYRHDSNDRFKDADTYRFQASYRFGDTRLRASAGSGIKNPTNFELFGFDPGSFIGNPNLKPEKSVGFDVGLDHQFWDGKAKVTATYFQATLENEIFTDFLPPFFVATPKNRTTESERRGVELTFDAAVDDWSINAAYTYTDALENGLEEVRRAPHVASLNVTYQVLEELSATLSVRYNGEQQDNEFVFATPQDFVTLPAFTLVNVGVQYDVAENVQLFGRVENLLDETYEETFSFRSPGIGAYAGIRTKF
ncbi:MAG: TonB-dependent receptor plug domain-containing protein [Micropepsaceae bacterium]